jgi:hypothetical protein
MNWPVSSRPAPVGPVFRVRAIAGGPRACNQVAQIRTGVGIARRPRRASPASLEGSAAGPHHRSLVVGPAQAMLRCQWLGLRAVWRTDEAPRHRHRPPGDDSSAERVEVARAACAVRGRASRAGDHGRKGRMEHGARGLVGVELRLPHAESPNHLALTSFWARYGRQRRTKVAGGAGLGWGGVGFIRPIRLQQRVGLIVHRCPTRVAPIESAPRPPCPTRRLPGTCVPGSRRCARRASADDPQVSTLSDRPRLPESAHG